MQESSVTHSWLTTLASKGQYSQDSTMKTPHVNVNRLGPMGANGPGSRRFFKLP